MQSLHDESELSKDEVDDIKAQLKKSRETLSKQTAKLNVTEGNVFMYYELVKTPCNRCIECV